jgi:hypothetical protein
MKPTTWLAVRMAGGAAVCGTFAGSFAGALVGVVCGSVSGDVSLGLDGALFGGALFGLAGASYGGILSFREIAAKDKDSGPNPADKQHPSTDLLRPLSADPAPQDNDSDRSSPPASSRLRNLEGRAGPVRKP